MAQRVGEVMTANPVILDAGSPIADAARRMRDQGIGDVLVGDGGRLRGLVTDRDITVRAVADGKDPRSTTLADVCSDQIVSVRPDTPIEEAVRLMRERSIRRLPVVEDDRPVGVVAIGDLAIERDSDSALADISAAPPNK